MRQPNYPRLGAIGVATPQANPTVEPEFQALAPDGVGVYVTRLTSQAKSSRLRLKNYLRQISRAAASFDTLPIQALGFACTGSSYLLGRSEEARLIEAAGPAFPVITATRAIDTALAELRARKIALISPYPDWLTEASVEFWRDGGYDITAVSRIAGQRDDTRSVYEVPEEAVLGDLDTLSHHAPQAILITGTGLPSLAMAEEINKRTGIPVLSSNLCLAAACFRHVAVR